MSIKIHASCVFLNTSETGIAYKNRLLDTIDDSNQSTSAGKNDREKHRRVYSSDLVRRFRKTA